MGKFKALNGSSVPGLKNTQDKPTESMPLPDVVTIVMSQHIGKPCDVVVSVGDYVRVGQKVGDSSEFISAPIHSGVSGIVKAVEDAVMPNGEKVAAVVIETDKKQEADDSVVPPTVNNREDFIKAVKDSGMVGLGGAGFPTHVKFSPSNLDEVDTLIINAAECEPYITSDNATIIEEGEDLVLSINETLKHLGISRCIIGIENNKPKAIKKLQSLAKQHNFEVAVLPALYPQGAEKVLIYQTVGRILPEGKFPADIGTIVVNVTTMCKIGKYLRTGMPLTTKRITIDGGAIKTPKTVSVPIGTAIKDVIEFTGGYKSVPSKIILGGPMMGVAIDSDIFPIMKQNNAVIAFGEKEETSFEETPCIRCGDCMRACPINLMPFSMKSYTTNGNAAELEKLKVNLCIECGCCSYVCPARQELVASHRSGKKILKDAQTAAKE